MSGASPPLTARPLGGLLGSATHVLRARVCGCGGPTLSLLACMPCGGCVPRGWWGAVPEGGWPATTVRDVWCQALSLPRPPVLWSGQRGFRDPCVPGAVGAGVGTQTGPTVCAVAGRRCWLWGWQKGVPGGGAFHHCEGRLVSGAVPPAAARPLERATRIPRPVCPGCGRCGRGDPDRPHSVRRCGPALLAVGVAEGRPQGGCLPPL